MTRPLRLLRIEEGPDVWPRVEHVLRQGGFDVQAQGQDSLEALRAALAQGTWDALLFEDGARHLTLAQVLDAVKHSGREVPVLVLSRGEGVGEESLRAGARDFFAHSHLARLPAALERELAAAHERAARLLAERDRALLSRAGELLARSLDFQETLNRVVRVMVPELSDWCAVFLPEGESLKLLALAHRDSERMESGFEFNRRFPLDPERMVNLMRAWRQGEALLLEEVPLSLLEVVARSPEHLRLLKAIRLRSVMYVPLLGRTECLGVLMLGLTGARSSFLPTDMALAQELARRGALALENARLYRAAQEAIHLRDDFLAVAAHELRTPLTTLGLQVSTLVQRARRESSPALVERLERGLRQVRRLGTLVESLLDVSRLSSGALPLALERVDLGELVDEVLERFAPEAQSLGCELVRDVAPGAVGQWDRLRVEQAVSSLVANALKFGPRQPVRVGCGLEGRVARVVVEDRGIGIPEGQLERIFERFGKAVSSRSYGGLGLGLYLARRVAEAHGGRLWAEHRAQGGARFTLELPLERA